MPKVHAPSSSASRLVERTRCQCGIIHGPDEGHHEISQEDMALMIDNWPPAIQQAFSERWKEHFAAEMRSASASGDRMPNGLSPHVFDDLIPDLVDGVTQDQLNAIANDEDLQHFEMTAGLSEAPRTASLPRRHVRIKRPGRQQQNGNAKARSSNPRNVAAPAEPRPSLTPIFLPEPPRGQKRSANSLFSDVPRPVEDPLPETPSTPSTDLSGVTEDLGDQLPRFVDMFTQQMCADGSMSLQFSDMPGEDLLGSDDLDVLLGNPAGGLSSNALHIAAATGRADLVHQQLCAGVDPGAWLPTSKQQDARATQERRVSGMQASSSMPRISAPSTPVKGMLLSPASSLEPARSLPSGLGHAQPQINPLNFDYCTAMHLAAYYGHWPVVKVLIESGTCDRGQLFSNRNAQGATALHMAAHKGCLEVVKGMVAVKQCDVNAVDNEGRTALHHASAQGHVGVTQTLWSAKCNIELADNHGWTALHHAADMGHVETVADLIIGGANVQRVDNRGYTPAHLAAAAGHVDVIEKLLGAGYEVDTLASVPVLGGVYSTGNTCLHLAAQNGHLEMVECLLDRGANPRLIDYRGCDALQCSVEGGHESVFSLLLESGCDPLACDHLGATLLHYAANGGNLAIIRRLLTLGCDKNAVTQYGRTVLHYAAFSCRADALEMLVGLGCSVHHADHEGNTPWHSAAQSLSIEVLQKLLQYGCSVNEVNNLQCTALHYAARTGCLPIVDLLLEKGSDINAVCVEGKTALHYATQMGHVEVVNQLFNYGADLLVNKEDLAQWSPLHFAAERGSLTLVKKYIEAGGDVNAQTQQGWTPLHLSTKDNRLQVVEELLAAGADSALQDSQGRTALHFSARIGDVKMFQTIFRHPTCKADLTDCRGFQLIHYAVEGGSREIVKFLIEQGYGTPDQTQEGRAFTPLHLASRAGHAELVSLLLNVGYQADRPDKDGRTPLHCAALGGHIGFLEANQNLMSPPGSVRPCIDHRFITKELLGQGVDPTALDDNLCTALHYACGSGDLEVVIELITLGCSPTAVDQIGWSPLMWASAGGHVAVIQELMTHGAEFQVKDNQGRWPLHWAAEKGHADAVDLLVKHLLDAQADLHLQDSVGFSAVNLAAIQGHVEVVGRILDASKDYYEKGYTALHLAVQSDLEELVQQLLLLPSTVVDARDADGQTALHLAAQDGKVKIAELLIGAKASIAAANSEAATPLHKAAACGSIDVVCILLSASGPNAAHVADMKTTNGVTALQLAAGSGHTALVQLLISAGANVNACPLGSTTALNNAANEGHLDVVKLLIENNASVNCQTGAGVTALHAAASSGHAEVVKYLLRKKANKDLKSQTGCTALQNAAANNHVPVVDMLLTQGAAIDVINSQGNTALHIAASKGHDKIVQSLVGAGANVHAKNAKNLTAVGCAATAGQLEAVVELVRQGAVWRNLTDVNVVKAIVRKTTYRASYLVGKLEIAERERVRLKKKAAAIQETETEEELRQKEAAAESIAAELIESEEAAKIKEGDRQKARAKKNKKKNKNKKASDVEDGDQEQAGGASLEEAEAEAVPQPQPPESPTPSEALDPPALSTPEVEVQVPEQKPKGSKGKGKKGREAAAHSHAGQESPGASHHVKAAATQKLQQNDTGWVQVGPSGKLGPQQQQVPMPAPEYPHPPPQGQASHGRKKGAPPVTEDRSAGKQPSARNAQRQGQRPGSRNRQPPGQRPPEADEPTRSETQGVESDQGWPSQHQAAARQARPDAARGQRPATKPTVTDSLHHGSMAPPPPPPKQPPAPAPPAQPQRPQPPNLPISEGTGSARSSPARPVMNGNASRFNSFPGSPPAQLSHYQNGAQSVRGAQQLSSSPLRPDNARHYAHVMQPASVPHSPARPGQGMPHLANNAPLQSSPLRSVSAQHLGNHSTWAGPPNSEQPSTLGPGPSALRSGLSQATKPSSQSSEGRSRPDAVSDQGGSTGGWNPLMGNTKSIIDWTHTSSSLHSSLEDSSSRVQSSSGVEAKQSQAQNSRLGNPLLLNAAFQNLNLQKPSAVDTLRPGSLSKSFLPVTSSRTSSVENLGTQNQLQQGGSMPPSLKSNPWGSSQAADGITSQPSVPEAHKPSKQAVCGITGKPMVNPVVASDMKIYERSAIEEWMKHNDYSPSDPNKKLTDKELYPAWTMIAINGIH